MTTSAPERLGDEQRRDIRALAASMCEEAGIPAADITDAALNDVADAVLAGDPRAFGLALQAVAAAPDTTPAPPLPGTVDAALSDLNAAYDAILASIPQAQDTIATLADVDPTLARLARDFFNRFLKLTGSSERVRLPNEPQRTTSRERTVTRTYDRYAKAKRAEAAAKRQADDLQACLEYALATTEPEDAYDLSNEERKTQREIDTLCRFIDQQRDIEARAAVRAETAQRVLIEMGELVE